MSNQFQSRPKKDNEATMRLFIDKLFGKDSIAFDEAGIADAKEAFHSAQSILRAANTKSTDGKSILADTKEEFHSAQSILCVTNSKPSESFTVSFSKKQSKEKKDK